MQLLYDLAECCGQAGEGSMKLLAKISQLADVNLSLFLVENCAQLYCENQSDKYGWYLTVGNTAIGGIAIRQKLLECLPESFYHHVCTDTAHHELAVWSLVQLVTQELDIRPSIKVFESVLTVCRQCKNPEYLL